MTRLAWLTLSDSREMAERLVALTRGEHVPLETRRFPDGETYLRIAADVAGRQAVILCSLDRPDDKFLTLVYAAATLRELGAKNVGLVAPYLAYMRQDKCFNTGEAVTSRLFAEQLSAAFDWLVTVDPHLHRYASLDAIYRIPSRVLHSQAWIGKWIGEHIADPLIIGPDAESEQWVRDVARLARCPHVVLRKRRLGDQRVAIEVPDLSALTARRPVLVDDIISSGTTMMEVADRLRKIGMTRPATCIGVHGIFAGDSYQRLASVMDRIVTTNTIVHATNAIDLSEDIAAAVLDMAHTPGKSTAAP